MNNNIFIPWYFQDFRNPVIENVVKPLEITQYTIVISGLKPSKYDSSYKPSKLEFRCKHSKKIVNIVDSIITPEMIILYVNEDTRKYPYNKCVLISKPDYATIYRDMYI